MAWMVEFEYKMLEHSKPRKHILSLDCPDDFKARQQAINEARKMIRKMRLQKPCLIWREKLTSPKRRKK